MPRYALLGLGILTCVAGCAHVPRTGSLETLKPVVESFHQRIRWKDYRGAGEFVVRDRQAAFTRARHERNDDRDLSVSDYQLEDARVEDGIRAVVVSRIFWVRLPSVTESSDLVTSEFVFRDGAWWLARQDSGPFTPELAAIYEWPAPDAG